MPCMPWAMGVVCVQLHHQCRSIKKKNKRHGKGKGDNRRKKKTRTESSDAASILVLQFRIEEVW